MAWREQPANCSNLLLSRSKAEGCARLWFRGLRGALGKWFQLGLVSECCTLSSKWDQKLKIFCLTTPVSHGCWPGFHKSSPQCPCLILFLFPSAHDRMQELIQGGFCGRQGSTPSSASLYWILVCKLDSACNMLALMMNLSSTKAIILPPLPPVVQTKVWRPAHPANLCKSSPASMLKSWKIPAIIDEVLTLQRSVTANTP